MRVTQEDLDKIVLIINKTTKSPLEPWRREQNNLIQNAGCFVLDYAYGGVCLERMSDKGQEKVIADYHSKKELYEKLHAFLAGIECGQLIEK